MKCIFPESCNSKSINNKTGLCAGHFVVVGIAVMDGKLTWEEWGRYKQKQTKKGKS